MQPKPLVLIILDGWGHNPSNEGNAIAQAKKPTWDELSQKFPHTLIHTSGPQVGLPDGQMGNSEVGHMNIGSGRIVLMDITRLDRLIASGEFYTNPILTGAMEHARGRRLHLMGLVSDGGVHSHQEHLYALLRLARQAGVESVFIHAFLDGRDTPPNSGIGYLEQLQQQIRTIGVGRIATVTGRYYAMDRDKRWERTQRAYGAIVKGEGTRDTDLVEAVRRSYEQGVTDEFVEPIVCADERGEPVGQLRDEDSLIFFNFRSDRARQLTRALTHPMHRTTPDLELEGMSRSGMPERLHYVTMTRYEKTSTLPRVLETKEPKHILAHIFAEHGLRNLRVAETEKYAHVTYFFNGGVEQPFPLEERILIPSPRVATFDLKPEMHAPAVADEVVKAVENRTFDFVIVNFANADMVGHTGKLEAAVKAVEAVDAGLGRIYAALCRSGGGMMITADHGNAEMMIDPVTGGAHTYHTTLPVPLILALPDENMPGLRQGGSLRDIAPTLLGIAGIPVPAEMSGADLRLTIQH